MENNKNIHFKPVTDKELLDHCLIYFLDLRRVVPSVRLKDACSGILSLVFFLISFLDDNKLIDYGNNEK